MEETIFEACKDAVMPAVSSNSRCVPAEYDQDAAGMVVDVIQAIIDRTPSPATVVELTRILREGGVDVPEATFD